MWTSLRLPPAAAGRTIQDMQGGDRDRQQTVQALCSGYNRGYMTVATLDARLARAFAAGSPDDLGTLTSDIPDEQSERFLRHLAGRVRRSVPPPEAAVVAVPDDAAGRAVIGRGEDCDTVLEDPTVSRHHLELRPIDGRRWLAVDLGSRNGTWFLGRRVGRFVVERGDELLLGECPVVVA